MPKARYRITRIDYFFVCDLKMAHGVFTLCQCSEWMMIFIIFWMMIFIPNLLCIWISRMSLEDHIYDQFKYFVQLVKKWICSLQDVQDQLIQLLPEFPSLSRLPGIAKYTAECCRVAWSMVNQIPPMEMEHSQDKFCANMHTRFHASSDKNSKIKMYVWPALVESGTKNVLFKGVVWT